MIIGLLESLVVALKTPISNITAQEKKHNLNAEQMSPLHSIKHTKQPTYT